MNEYLLTTVDNPYSPFTENRKWRSFDHSHGYFTEGLIARVAVLTDDETDTDNDLRINAAFADIICAFPELYRRVKPSDYPQDKRK